MVKSTARLRPSTSASQIVNMPPPMTHMGQENNQANGQSPMHTLPLPTLEHVQQQKNRVPSRQNHLHHSPCLLMCGAHGHSREVRRGYGPSGQQSGMDRTMKRGGQVSSHKYRA